jgi:hypothetical protein
MLSVLRRKKRSVAKTPDERIHFGTITHESLMSLVDACRTLQRHIPRFIVEREKGLDILRTVEEYHHIQRALEVLERRFELSELNETTAGADIEISFEPSIASGFALALSELILVCRAFPSDEKQAIANVANFLLKGYLNASEASANINSFVGRQHFSHEGN